MAKKYIVTLKQATVKPDGTQLLAVYGTVQVIEDSTNELLIGGKMRIYWKDTYTIVEHDADVNEELIWVL